MEKILVTGADGFVGRHLTREIASQGFEVDGLTLNPDLSDELRNSINGHIVCDLNNQSKVSQINFSDYRAIINLAGLSNVGDSFKDPEKYMQVNVNVLSNLCDALVKQKLGCRVVAISSAVVYKSEQPMPLTEDSVTTGESSPYAQSKLTMEKEAMKFIDKGVDCVVARPFNHIGPGQGPGFLARSLCYQLLVDPNKPIRVGNMHSKRDYTDVRDVARAYVDLALAEDLNHTIYNICSGTSRTGLSIFEELQSQIPNSDGAILEVDPSLLRPNDPPELVGSNQRIFQEVGWRPSIPFKQTISDIIQSVRNTL